MKLESRWYTHLWKTGETTIHQLMEDKRNRDTVYRLMEEGQQYTDSWTIQQQYTDLWKVRETQTNAESKWRQFTPQPGSGRLTSPPFIDPSPVVFTVPAPDEGALGVSDGMGLMPGWCGVCWVPESATSSPPACTDWNHHTISSLSVGITKDTKTMNK